MVIFTDEELSLYKLVQLKRLADYYNVAYTSTTTKAELIKSLSAVLNTPDPVSVEYAESNSEPQQSVRVRRIAAQNKEG